MFAFPANQLHDPSTTLLSAPIYSTVQRCKFAYGRGARILNFLTTRYYLTAAIARSSAKILRCMLEDPYTQAANFKSKTSQNQFQKVQDAPLQRRNHKLQPTWNYFSVHTLYLTKKGNSITFFNTLTSRQRLRRAEKSILMKTTDNPIRSIDDTAIQPMCKTLKALCEKFETFCSIKLR